MDLSSGTFAGPYLVDDIVRLFVIFIGFTLSLTCVRIAGQAFKRRDTERVWAVLSYGALLLSPALTGIFRFGQPINRWSTTAYLVGLICGIVALSYRVVLSPPWKRIRHRWHTKQEAKMTATRDREDTDRKWSRKAEDDALRSDRLREDDVTQDARGREDDAPSGSDHA